MSTVVVATVVVTTGPEQREIAQALLAVAASLGYEPRVVKSVTNGFLVPSEVGDAYIEASGGAVSALLDGVAPPVVDEPEPAPVVEDEPKKPKPRVRTPKTE